MSDTGHIKHYSAADIQRYLEGKMLPAEMHALEQAALDDPFLADAIEGMQQTLAQHDASVINTHLEDIQRQVQERTRKQTRIAPVRAFRWWQAAAAAVIVITGGIWGYNYFQQTESKAPAQSLAVVKQEEKQDSTPPIEPNDKLPYTQVDKANEVLKNLTTTEENKESAKLADETAANAQSYKSTTGKADKERNIQSPAVSDNSLAARQKNEVALVRTDDKQIVGYGTVKKTDSIKDLNFDKAAAWSKTVPGVAITPAKPVDYEQIVIAKQARDTTKAFAYTKPRERAMNTSRKELSERQAKKNPNALLSGFISGRVTDQSNNPLSNALLRVNDNREFLTDHKGNFKIPANDSVVNVAVGVTGYYTQNLRLLNNTYDNNIALNQLGIKAPNPQLNSESTQVVRIRGISSLGAVKSKEEYKSNYPEVRIQDAEPADGWLAYQQYLEKNRKIPAASEELTGTVVVSFQVNRKGTLSDFKIEQSLGKEYDEEAIRLIKEGPSWKLLKGRKTKATVLVRF